MDIETARRLFSYEPGSGVVTWRVDNGKSVRAGARAGCVDTSSGYRKIRYRDQAYQEHRIAWMIHYGEPAPQQIDHINRVRDDNKIANLRSATAAENAFNKSISSANSSGVPGVYWSAEHRRWKAQISVRGKRHFLGLHASIADAKAARSHAEIHHFGAFRAANTNVNIRDAA